jgi:hypothetical protein
MKHPACQRILGIDSDSKSDKPPSAVLSNAPINHQHSLHGELGLDEQERTDLITEIVSIIRFSDVPPHVVQAALTFTGWLARRQSTEHPCQTGVSEAKRQSILPTTDRR